MALLDWDSFLERMDRNESLATELVTDLLPNLERRYQRYADAIISQNCTDIAAQSHSLRGLLAPYGCQAILVFLKVSEEDARKGVQSHRVLPEAFVELIRILKAELIAQIAKMP